MRKILFGVSATTLALLYGLLVLILLIVFELVGIPLIIALIASAIALLIQFLISPFLTDLTQRWFYRTKFDAEIPAYLRAFIEEVCRENNMKYPRMGYIDDGAPNAFTYGHTKNNARVVLTRGIFELLTEDEVKAVVAHELGHAVHYDMLLMTVAELVPMVLYGIASTPGGSVSSIREFLQMSSNRFTPYRTRLIRKGIINGDVYGVIRFELPLFEDYVLENYMPD